MLNRKVSVLYIRSLSKYCEEGSLDISIGVRWGQDASYKEAHMAHQSRSHIQQGFTEGSPLQVKSEDLNEAILSASMV